MAKINFKDIPQYTGSVRHKVDIGGNYLLKFLDEQRKQEGLDMDPDFQRGHVWSPENQTRYIEHLLRGGETSRTIVWNCPTYEMPAAKDRDAPSEMVIVDGKQRITAVIGFLNNEVPVFGGHYMHDFDETGRRIMLSPLGSLRLSMHIHALQYRHELLQLYIEMNEGAIAHTSEEIARVKSLREEALSSRKHSK